MGKASSAKMLRGSSATLHTESNVPCSHTHLSVLHRSLLDTIPHTLHIQYVWLLLSLLLPQLLLVSAILPSLSLCLSQPNTRRNAVISGKNMLKLILSSSIHETNNANVYLIGYYYCINLKM